MSGLLYIRISSAESYKFSRDQRRNQPTTLGLELNSQHLRNLALLPESGVRHQGTTLVGARTLVLGPDHKGSLLATDHCGLFCTKAQHPSPRFFLLFFVAGTSAVCLSALPESRYEGELTARPTTRRRTRLRRRSSPYPTALRSPQSAVAKNSPTTPFLCLLLGVEVSTESSGQKLAYNAVPLPAPRRRSLHWELRPKNSLTTPFLCLPRGVEVSTGRPSQKLAYDTVPLRARERLNLHGSS